MKVSADTSCRHRGWASAVPASQSSATADLDLSDRCTLNLLVGESNSLAALQKNLRLAKLRTTTSTFGCLVDTGSASSGNAAIEPTSCFTRAHELITLSRTLLHSPLLSAALAGTGDDGKAFTSHHGKRAPGKTRQFSPCKAKN